MLVKTQNHVIVLYCTTDREYANNLRHCNQWRIQDIWKGGGDGECKTVLQSAAES